MKRMACMLLLLMLALAGPALAAEKKLTVAIGAGYKLVLEDLAVAFEQDTGVTVERIYGNMGHVLSQARESGLVDVVGGDKAFLDATDIAFTSEASLGLGRLVLAVAKGKPVTRLEEIAAPEITRVALADPKKAIYGKAATQYLQRAGLAETVKAKVLEVGTVPQVVSYLLTGEVDAGFINLTEAQPIQDKVERILPVDPALHDPILLVAKVLASAPSPEEAGRFAAFLATDKGKAILKKHGL